MKSLRLVIVLALLVPALVHAQRSITIGVSHAYVWHPVHAAIKAALDETAAKLGVKLVNLYSDDSYSQKACLLDLISQKVDGIVVTPIDMDTSVSAIEKAVAAGIPVATVDRKADTDKVLVHVGADDLEGGRMAARFIVEKLGNKGSVVELEGQPEASPSIERKKGFEEVLRASNVKLLTSQIANFDRHTATYVMAELMIRHPKFDAVFAANDDMILGALDAMIAAGIDPSRKVTVGWDAGTDALDAVRNGQLSATFEAFPRQQASTALTILVDYIRTGRKPAKAILSLVPKLITR